MPPVVVLYGSQRTADFNNFKIIKYSQMTNIEHNCEICRYKTSKKSSFINHLKTKKHLKIVNGDNMSVTSDMTETSDYCIE